MQAGHAGLPIAVAVMAVLLGCQPAPYIGAGEAPERPAEPLKSTPPRALPTELEAPEEQARPPRKPVIQPGTGTFLRPPPARSRASIGRGGGEVTLNVVDADIREVVRLVLEDALGVNYIIDPAVGGTVTVQTSRPVPAENLVPMLDAILRVNGAALVQVGDLFKVVPIDQALHAGIVPDVRPVVGTRKSGFGIEVLPVRYVSAAEVARLLEPFVPPGGSLQVDGNRNLLILAGPPDARATLAELVATFDVDWLAGMSFGLFPLEEAAAGAVTAELDQIFGDLVEGPLAGVVRFVPIERLNAVLVISSQPEYLRRAQAWIDELDRLDEGEDERIFVYTVQNGRARDLAAVLAELFEITTTTVTPTGLLAPGAEPVEIRSSGFTQPGQDGEKTAESPDGQPPPAPAPSR